MTSTHKEESLRKTKNKLLDENQEVILGIDIGGTKTAVLLGTVTGEVLLRAQFLTKAERAFKEYFDELTGAISQLLMQVKCRVSVISVSVGGPLDVINGIIKSPPNLPTWINIPLKRIISERFNLPVYVEHDGNAGALAEFYFGAGRNHKNVVFLTLGTGFGAGVILDGRLYRGTTFTAGEIGHIRASEEGPFAYGKRGSLEGFCSGAGIEKLAEVMYPAVWGDGITAKELATLAKKGDPNSINVFSVSGKFLGRAFAILADLLNPEIIILGGLGFRLRDLIIRPAMEEFEKEALPESFGACSIVPAELDERIGDVAALCAAIDQGNFI